MAEKRAGIDYAKEGVAYTMDGLKGYVAGGEGRRYAQGIVALDITHNLIKRNFVEIPFETNWTIERCKEKIFTMMGTQIDTMVLTLEGTVLDNARYLADYSPQTGMLMHVVDNDPYSKAKGGGLDDVSLVKKYVMSDEDYAKRDNTYLAFKKKMLAKDPNWKPVSLQGAPQRPKAGLSCEEELKPETYDEIRARMKISDRCEVMGGRRGVVMYVGPVPEIPSTDENVIWVGVKFDEATGKNDGSIKGTRYFQAGHNEGGFIKSQLVKAGDYPEKDPFASDDEDLMEEL